ncbi:MAG: rane protein of unknown function [Myxococcaceae bacterium]|nr:rane protein of unknown function [Myxococcaceae bacterium]
MRGRWAAPRSLFLLQLGVALACLLALRTKWSTVHAFVVAVDHGDVLFADFVNHYYPTVTDGLRSGAPAGGFFYPAGFAVLLSPLALLGPTAAKVVWGVVQIACVLYVATALVAAVVPRRPLLALLGTALTVTSVPVLHNLKWGQVSVPILAATGAAFVLRSRGKKNLPAALLGIAAGIKGYPLVFVGWFIARRDLGFVGRAAIACLVTLVLLPAIVMGPAHALFFQRVSTGAVMGAADGVLRDFNSQYAPAVMGRYEGGWDATSYDHRAMGELGAMAALVLVAALVVLLARSQAPRLAERRDMLAFVLVACTVPFWLRTSWSHYFVHLPLAQTLLAGMLAERSSSRSRARDVLVLAVLVAPSVFLSNVLGLFATEGWWYYANAGSLFFANALVLLACAGVIVDAHVRCVASERRAPETGGAIL